MAFTSYIGYALKNLFTKPSTEKYPAQPRHYEERYRGHIENDISKCILCGMCMRSCPSSAITVSKPAYSWKIRPFSGALPEYAQCLYGARPRKDRNRQQLQ